jgi:endonuclease/exonuclease/phosphatase family metal-dependent hydrolase
MTVRVVTWNLFHGRAQPPRDRDLMAAFAERLAGWEWTVALLQEVPPWWPPALAAACSAQQRTALTSRNALLPLRRALAQRRPELMKSSGGGANAILVRGTITAAARRRLRLWPERRVLQAARDGEGRWFANLHATVDDAAAARRDIARARDAALGWAAGAPLVLGGDFNVRDPELPGFLHAAGDGVDHIFCRGGLVPARGTGTELLDRGTLSDHPAVRAVLERAT